MTFEEYKQTEAGTQMLEKAKRQLTMRGFSTGTDADVWDEIENAINSVNERRHFIPTNETLFESKYNSIVIRLVIASYSKMGAEGQISHSENGISRTYAGASEHPNDILKEIVPLGRIKSL